MATQTVREVLYFTAQLKLSGERLRGTGCARPGCLWHLRPDPLPRPPRCSQGDVRAASPHDWQVLSHTPLASPCLALPCLGACR